MPNLAPDVKFKTPLETTLNMAFPSIVCGVSRKVNTGNYENIDIMCGITVPIMIVPTDDQLEVFKEATNAAASLGFALTSKETWERYKIIKEAQKAQQEEVPQ